MYSRSIKNKYRIVKKCLGKRGEGGYSPTNPMLNPPLTDCIINNIISFTLGGGGGRFLLGAGIGVVGL